MKIIKKIYLLLLFILLSVVILAQSTDHQQVTDNSATEYLQASGSQSALYYGRIHEGHPRLINHPYLIDERFAKARLSYRGIIYPDVLLRLDLNRSELVIQSPGFLNIVLFPEDVEFAELHNQTVIYFQRNNLPGCPPTGYYILLYSGKCEVLKRQTAALMLANTQQRSTSEFYYDISTLNYLYKDGVYHTIRNKRGLLKILYPHKRELKRFISANKLRFRQNSDLFITRTIIEYEKLSSQL